MNKQEILNKLQDKLEETFKCQKCFPTESDIYFTYEAAAVAYMTAINYVEQLEETPSQKMALNKNQQIVVEWLKGLSLFPISAIHLLEAGKNVPANVKMAYEYFDKQDERQLLAAFAEWGMKNEL